MPDWFWDNTVFDYVADDGTAMGRYDIEARSRRMVRSSSDELADIAIRIKNGGIPADVGRDALREEMKREHIRQYLLGRGGRSNMTFTDWGSVGGSLAEQFSYLERNVIPNLETMTEGQIRHRMAMYANSSREAFYRGASRARGFDPNDLPYFPADGLTICLTKCQCSWNFIPVYDDDGELIGWDCYWILSSSPLHCDTCETRANESAPYEIRFAS